jgi:hypothetical protein
MRERGVERERRRQVCLTLGDVLHLEREHAEQVVNVGMVRRDLRGDA